MKKIAIISILLAMFTPVVFSQKNNWCVTKQDGGIQMNRGNETMNVKFVNPSVVRIQYVPEGELTDNGTIICLPQKPENIKWKLKF